MAYFLPNHPEQSSFVGDAELKYIRGGVEAPRNRTARNVRHGFTDWRLLLTNRTLLANYWAFFVFGYFLFFFMGWLPNYLEETYGLKVREVGLFTVLPWACAAVLLVALSYLSDYLLARTGRLRISRSLLIGVSQLLAALAVIPVGLMHSLPVAIVCITAAVAFGMSANAAYYAVNVDIVPHHAATALGIMDTGFAISGFLAPAITGWVVHAFGSFEYAFLLMAVLALSSVLVVRLHRHTRPRRSAGGCCPGDARGGGVGCRIVYKRALARSRYGLAECLRTSRFAQTAPMPRIIPEPRYRSIPSRVVGGLVLRKAARNCPPWVRSLIHAPVSWTNSPAAIIGAWPITVIRSLCPRALTAERRSRCPGCGTSLAPPSQPMPPTPMPAPGVRSFPVLRGRSRPATATPAKLDGARRTDTFADEHVANLR